MVTDTTIAIVIAGAGTLAILRAVKYGLAQLLATAAGLAVLLYMLKSHPRGWSILAALQRFIGQLRWEFFENWPGATGANTLANESGHNIAAIKLEIQRRIPESGRLFQLQKDSQSALGRFYNEAGHRTEFARGMGAKVDYYFNKSYIEIWSILGGRFYTGTSADRLTAPDGGQAEQRLEVLPQHHMVNLLNTQRKLVAVLENTVFVNNGHSDTDPAIQALIHDIKREYAVINRYLADWVNHKTADQVNIYSGYLDYPDTPKPMNIYGDSYYHRLNKFY